MDYLELHQPIIDNGYLPIPIKPNDKRPAITNWTAPEYKVVEGFRGYGVGILTGRGKYPICGIDCDVFDAGIAGRLSDYILQLCGEAPYRIGLYPKMFFVYRAEKEGIRKLSSRHYENLGHVEVWGMGQQFVAFGTHPDTKKPYTWPGILGDILDNPAFSLPVITVNRLQDIMQRFEQMAEAAGYKPKEKEKKQELLNSDYDPLDPLDQKEPINLGQDKCRELLKQLEPDLCRDEWLHIGMALHHEFQGSDEGLALWDDWSTRGAKYKEGEPERLWASFGGYSGQPLTAAYLLKLTKKPAPVDPNFFKALPWSTSRFVADPPAIPMIIEGFLPQGVISLFYSAGGAGKSTIVLYMAVKIALAESFNTDFLGHYVQGGKVVIVTAEDPDLILNRRFVGCLESIAEELDVTPEALRPTVDANLSIVSTFGHSVQLFSLRADGILVTSEYYDSLSTALCEVQGLQLVIIDTKTRFSPGEGLGNVTATQEITHYEALAKTTGASVMLLHHSNKSSRDGSGTGAQAYRDATALFDSVRAAWYLRGLTEAELSAQEVTLEDKRAYLLLENSKNNYIPQDVDKVLKRVGYRYEVSKLKPRMTNVDKKELKRQQAYDRVIDLLQSHIGEPYHQSAIISICANRNMSRQRVIDALKDCEEDGMVLKIEKGICKKYSLTEEGKMYKLTVDEVA